MTETGEAARPPAELDIDPESWLDTIRSRQRELSITAIVLVVAVAAVWAWRSSARQKEANAERALNQAANSYYSGNKQLARTDLEKMVQRFSGTPAGVQGAMLLAQIHYESGQYDQGRTGLEAARSGSGSQAFASSIEALIAAGYADQKKYDDAARHYLDGANKARFASDRDLLRAEGARMLTLAGKPIEAKKIWEEIATRLDSPAFGEAKIRLGELASTAGATK